MKNKNLLTLIMLLCFAFTSCDNTVESETETTTTEITSEKTATLATLLTDDKCFDERMNKWFVEFNQLQDKGLDMNEANTGAIAMVSRELKDCNGESEMRTATHEEVIEE
jgi:hypothetical protein